jgi:predicted alpha/beta-hydrolase family hydrolase
LLWNISKLWNLLPLTSGPRGADARRFIVETAISFRCVELSNAIKRCMTPTQRYSGGMGSVAPETLCIAVDAQTAVSGLLLEPSRASCCFVFAHGAGAGMAHPFMATFAQGLADRGITSLRYQFAYMERGSKRPDRPAAAHAAVRAAVAAASKLTSGLPLVAGGKSFGARMTSQAQAESPLESVVALAFAGFPLHPTGKPAVDRAAHLSDVTVPMLFLQGTRDELADMPLLESVVARLAPRATLAQFVDADHSFHVPSRSGRNDAQVMKEMLDRFADWVDRVT